MTWKNFRSCFRRFGHIGVDSRIAVVAGLGGTSLKKTAAVCRFNAVVTDFVLSQCSLLL